MPELQNPFEIDPARLDFECLQQAKLSRAAGVREADVRHAHAQAKARLDVVAARLTLAVRKSPDAFGLGVKATVGEIEAVVITQPGYEKALAEMNQAKYELDIAGADTFAYIDRRKMIERLVDLLALDFHAEREPKPRTAEGRENIARARTKDSVGEGITRGNAEQ